MKNVVDEDKLDQLELMSFKIIRSEFIELTKSNGNVYFGCADYYSFQEENTGNKGQGDRNEGLYARIKKDNFPKIEEQQQLHGPDLVQIKNGNFIDLKLKSVINLPVYCFYSINSADPDVTWFQEPNKSAKIFFRTYEFPIRKEVFEDFSAGEFGVMHFLNHNDLSSRVEIAIQSEGNKETSKNRIKYVDRHDQEWWCPEPHPAELFYKDAFFKYQREGRIVLTDNKFRFIHESDRSKKYRAINIGEVKEIVSQPIPIGNLRVVIPRVRFEQK